MFEKIKLLAVPLIYLHAQTTNRVPKLAEFEMSVRKNPYRDAGHDLQRLHPGPMIAVHQCDTYN